MKEIDEKEVRAEADAMIEKLNSMSVEELNEFYIKFKKATKLVDAEIEDVQGKLNVANEKMKDRDQDQDTIYKIVFASCAASLIGGATLGGIFGQSMTHFIGGAVLGTAYGTIFVSLLAACIHEKKPVAKMVQAVRKFFLNRKLDKLEEKKQINQQISEALAERI